MENFLSSALLNIKATTEEVIQREVAPHAEAVDREALWPANSMQAFARAGLTGLQVPEKLGGHGQGLLALSLLTETISKTCPSSALCFGMHCVGTAVIAAKATDYQQTHYLRPIAAGQHITSLALAEAGTGAHFYLPETSLIAGDGHFQVNGTKQFITNGGHADSYVVSTQASEAGSEQGDFSCLIVDKDLPNMTWQAPWEGFGMRGNSSRGLKLDNTLVPKENLLGEEGDQVWYMFEVVTPYFLIAMAGTYLGIAQSALDVAAAHLRSRRHTHSGLSLRDHETLQVRFAEMWMAVEKTRGLIREAAKRGDLGHPDALQFILSSKADAGDTAVTVANEAMTICGGSAYQQSSRVAQMLRDARASHIMSPTTDLLKIWTGRALLGLPLL